MSSFGNLPLAPAPADRGGFCGGKVRTLRRFRQVEVSVKDDLRKRLLHLRVQWSRRISACQPYRPGISFGLAALSSPNCVVGRVGRALNGSAIRRTNTVGALTVSPGHGNLPRSAQSVQVGSRRLGRDANAFRYLFILSRCRRPCCCRERAKSQDPAGGPAQGDYRERIDGFIC